MRATARFVISSVVVALLLDASLAWANDQKVRQAKEHFQRAETLYRVSNFGDALAEFKKALALVNRPSIILNVAQCHRQLENFDKSVFFYKLYLTQYGRAHPEKAIPHHEAVKGHIAKLTAAIETKKKEQEAARRAAEAAAKLPGRVGFGGLPDGARVEVDGALMAKAPLKAPLELAPGRHEIRISRFGFVPWRRTISVQPKSRNNHDAGLKRTKLWLVLGLSTLALGAAAEVGAVLFTLEARDQFHGTAEWEKYRNGALASHIVAGVLGAAALTSLIIHWRLGRLETNRSATTITVVPTSGGALVSGGIQY